MLLTTIQFIGMKTLGKQALLSLTLVNLLTILIPTLSFAQVNKNNTAALKKGLGYYIDNQGNKTEGKIEISCAGAYGAAQVALPRIEIKIGNAKAESVKFDQIQRVVIEADTFIRTTGRKINFSGSVQKELEHDMLYIKVPGKIKYCKRYWYSISGRSSTKVVKLPGKDYISVYYDYKKRDELKEQILSWIKDNPEVYNKWKEANGFKLYKKLEEIIMEYNAS